MAHSRRTFLGGAGVALGAQAKSAQAATGGGLDAVAIARRHALVRTQPTPDFFEGMQIPLRLGER